MVKLVRVLMLGPVVLCLSLLRARLHEAGDGDEEPPPRTKPRPHQLLPWFIVGFLLLAAARAAGAVPEITLDPLSTLATWLTILAMAALGLGVDVRTVAKAGGRIASVVTLSLLLLGLVAWLLIRTLGIA